MQKDWILRLFYIISEAYCIPEFKECKLCGFLLIRSLCLYLPILSLSQTCSHCLDTPEENPYFPTYKFPELPEILQNSEGTLSLDSASVFIALN